MDNQALIEYALKKLDQNKKASHTYYHKVKNTEEYKEKRKRWNRAQYEKKKVNIETARGGGNNQKHINNYIILLYNILYKLNELSKLKFFFFIKFLHM